MSKIKLHITDTPNSQDEAYVIQNTWAFNEQYTPVDIHPLFLSITDEFNKIIAGLVFKAWWSYLKIQYFWVSEKYRQKGLGKQLILKHQNDIVI
ncbi:hypothetical protein Xbud_02147 [Xenorhabdus budapestensis]|uniref:N-acetyltransferase domain-containing protein n=1 Tax=Xenorhabdus budapestensis TaxID=290110 RepID=A0A2D0J036_XENBU|nr:hypothetical protein Xbud_02147 [Xenorhabdus budapestensis]